MNKLDQFIKHKLKEKYYIRYADDFVLFSGDKELLKRQIVEIVEFLRDELKLELHPNKVFIKTINSGVDFLGWVNFSDYRVLRTTTKRRMIKNIKNSAVALYLGMLKHGNTNKLQQDIIRLYCK